MGAALAQVGRFIICNRKLYTQNSLAGKYNFRFLQGARGVGTALAQVGCFIIPNCKLYKKINIKNVKRCRDGMPKVCEQGRDGS